MPNDFDQLCQLLSTKPTVEAVAEAAELLTSLRDSREFDRLCALADLVCRLSPDNAKARRLYAQGLIEIGRLSAAIGMLEAAKQRYGVAHKEYAEFEGLLGRAYKQLFMDTVDPDGTWARGFIERSFAEYNAAYVRDHTTNFWHGINLGALSHVASDRGIALDCCSAREYTTELLVTLETIAPEKRDQWWYATKAEAHAALSQWEASEEALRTYIDHQETTPFMLASTLRQLRNLWAIQSEPRGARLLQMLEAVLMTRPEPGAVLKIGSQHLLDMRALEPRDDEQLQRVIGARGFETIQWYRKGLERAASVAAITERLGLRFGTGFAVRAGDFGIQTLVSF